MLLLLATLIPGILLGWAWRGRLRNLADLTVIWPLAPVLALAMQASLGLIPLAEREPYRVPVVLASYAALGVWLVANVVATRGAARAGYGAIAVGWLLNLVPVALNGGMPVSAAAAATAGISADRITTDGQLYKHVLLTPDSVTPWLGDVIGVPPPLAAAISVGDILLWAGVVLLVAAGMRCRPEGAAVASSTVFTARRPVLAGG